jgi:hypothetical protein
MEIMPVFPGMALRRDWATSCSRVSFDVFKVHGGKLFSDCCENVVIDAVLKKYGALTALAKVTKPNPRLRLVTRSIMTTESMTSPNCSKN